jgi:hypothetical protein
MPAGTGCFGYDTSGEGNQMIRRFQLAVALIALFAAPAVFAFAHEESIHAKGTLIDVMCGAEVKTQEDADTHSRKCGLMKSCVASGYGIVVDGKFHKFDAEGSKKAEAIFRGTTKEDHIAATVDGTLEDDGSITVKTLTEEK